MKNAIESPEKMSDKDLGDIIIPHAQREPGKVIGVGVHIYIFDIWNRKPRRIVV